MTQNTSDHGQRPAATDDVAEEQGWLRRRVSGPATAILAATVLLFIASAILQPESLAGSSLAGMLPFAAILAIVAVGQTLVIQQGGIDLSVPGIMSLTVVIVTHYPAGDSGKLPGAVLGAFVVAALGGLAQRAARQQGRRHGDRHHARDERAALRRRPGDLGRHPSHHHPRRCTTSPRHSCWESR